MRAEANQSHRRMAVEVKGAVQGVGFRPFVYRLARELALAGWVRNTPEGVVLEVEGPGAALEEFLARLPRDKPPHAVVRSLHHALVDARGETEFVIRASEGEGPKTAAILPDLASCDACVAEILDPLNRRYRYPFTNCTHCGPRFTIIRELPYDRPRTTMRDFAMCPECRAEYENPLDRRFHAQPIACPACGPELAAWNSAGQTLARRDEALLVAVEALRRGEIVAVKGLGGFHLMVDARREEAVARLRQRKHREEKPLALMFPGMAPMRAVVEISELEEHLLLSAAAPIVLLRRRRESEPAPDGVAAPRTVAAPRNVAGAVAPGNPTLGAMLPYTPLHHLLLRELGFPVVATSGNLSEEPICTDEREALERLGGLADLFLVHNRPIARHVDDSVVRVVLGRALMLRRARGYAPAPVAVRESLPPMAAVGGHQKNVVAVGAGHQVFLSQHIGDLETLPAYTAFRRVLADLAGLYDLQPEHVACDAHPDYLSTKHALAWRAGAIRIQHHHAHVVSCMADNGLEGAVLGISWDGSGYGPDGTVWGGEFLRATAGGFERAAHLRTFVLPGGDRAVREPRRSALGVLHEIYGEELWSMRDLAPLQAFTAEELRVLAALLARGGPGAPRTSSAGRLFDAAASLAGLRHFSAFEGQAAMELEFAAEGVEDDDEVEAYPVRVVPGTSAAAAAEGSGPASSPLVVDWEPLVRALVEDVRRGVAPGRLAARFHAGLAEAMVAVARAVGERRVVLTGGCFQNRLLLEFAVTRLRAAGFEPYWHREVPPNDGGLALGQLVAAAHRIGRASAGEEVA